VTSAQMTPGTELARVLAGLPTWRQLDMVLRAGKLKVDDRSRAVLDAGLPGIKHEYVKRDNRRDRDRTKAFADIAKASNALLQACGTDAGRRAVWVIDQQAVLMPRIDMTALCNTVTELQRISTSYHQLYGYEQTRRRRPKERDDQLFYHLYHIFAKIKEARPGNTLPLFNFTMKCAEILGIKIGFVTPDAFRMRISRILQRERATFVTMASFYQPTGPNMPLVTSEPLLQRERATFVTMASLYQPTGSEHAAGHL
jgi:hypothetical protein